MPPKTQQHASILKPQASIPAACGTRGVWQPGGGTSVSVCVVLHHRQLETRAHAGQGIHATAARGKTGTRKHARTAREPPRTPASGTLPTALLARGAQGPAHRKDNPGGSAVPRQARTRRTGVLNA
jgi:hypothetical protein